MARYADIDKVLEIINEVNADGGYTQYNTFEDPPKDWNFWCDIDAWLCPSCKKEYLQTLQDFMKK